MQSAYSSPDLTLVQLILPGWGLHAPHSESTAASTNLGSLRLRFEVQ